MLQALNNFKLLFYPIYKPLLIVAYVFFTIAISRLPAINFAEFSPFWPVTAVAIALGTRSLNNLFWVAAALFFWSFYFYDDLVISLILTLGLSGSFLFCIYKLKTSENNYFKIYKISFQEYLALAIFVLLPSTLAGSIAYKLQQEQYSLLDIVLTYSMSEILGLLIFYPLTMALLEIKDKGLTLNPIHFLLIISIAILPVVFASYGFDAYSNAAKILIFPLFALLASSFSRDGLIFSCLILAVVATFFYPQTIEGASVEQQVAGMLNITFWLISIIFTTQVLYQIINEKKELLANARDQALQNERTGIANKRQMKIDYRNTENDFLSLIQIKNRGAINQAFKSRDIDQIEGLVADKIAILLGSQELYHVSELRYAVLSKEKLRESAERIQEIKIEINGSELLLSVAWGIVQSQGISFEEDYSQANAALNIALRKPTLRIYGPEDEGLIELQLGRLAEYQTYAKAMQDDGLRVYYQEIQDIQNGENSSAEVLARLMVEGELVSPIKFLNSFKSFDALSTLDRKIVEEVFKLISGGVFHAFKRININLTGATLSDDSFIPWLDTMIAKYGQCKKDICFEITESDLIRDWDVALRTASEIKTRGFLLAIDDFGSGLASFEYLQKFWFVDVLKLDGMFVKDADSNKKQQSIIQATVDIARTCGIDVCAEFVENQDVMAILKESGVKYAQGYFIAKPKPV